MLLGALLDVASEFFVLLERLYVFVSGSFIHDLWLKTQIDMYPGEIPKELQMPSDTRWACRYVSCRVVRDRLQAIVRLLTELTSGVNDSLALDARALLLHIDRALVAMLTLMTDVHTVSKMLQSPTVDTGTD